MIEIFEIAPSAQLLHWLVQGQLASSWSRAVRFWVILKLVYGDRQLPLVFRYPDFRDRLFAPSHPTSDKLKADALVQGCSDPHCICHRPARSWLDLTPAWQQEAKLLTGWSDTQLEAELERKPFATVHRSIRSDLAKLVQFGWLKAISGGWQCLPINRLPHFSDQVEPFFSASVLNDLTPHQRSDLLVAIENLATVQPSLETLVEILSRQMSLPSDRHYTQDSPPRRTFFHFDYILSGEDQDRVDDYHQQLEELWHTRDGGVVQFDYQTRSKESGELSSSPWSDRLSPITVYPVCIHYMRRAKYLSAYGNDPNGQVGWHNYRLDRIRSPKLTVLAWGDPAIPSVLKQMRNSDKLPTSQTVAAELQKAWGFKFYVEPQLLLMRFAPDFARWYVERTVRHETFQRVIYAQIPALLRKSIPNEAERGVILDILKVRSPDDCYYRCWVRADDINIVQRLRDWRPHGEVIAPLVLRRRMAEEATQELQHYLPIRDLAVGNQIPDFFGGI